MTSTKQPLLLDTSENHSPKLARAEYKGRIIGALIGILAALFMLAVLSILASNNRLNGAGSPTSFFRRLCTLLPGIICAIYGSGRLARAVAADMWRFFVRGWLLGAAIAPLSFSIVLIFGFGASTPFTLNAAGCGRFAGAVIIGGFLGIILGLCIAVATTPFRRR